MPAAVLASPFGDKLQPLLPFQAGLALGPEHQPVDGREVVGEDQQARNQKQPPRHDGHNEPDDPKQDKAHPGRDSEDSTHKKAVLNSIIALPPPQDRGGGSTMAPTIIDRKMA